MLSLFCLTRLIPTKFFYFPFLLVFALLFQSCEPVHPDLTCAEQMLEKTPQAALNILQRQSDEFCRSEKNRAFYGLLLFKALDRADKDFAADSIIDFSIHYYEKSKQNDLLAESYFIKGISCWRRYSYEPATVSFLKSRELAVRMNNMQLLGKIYLHLGDLFSIRGNHKEARQQYLKAIKISTKAGDTYNSILATICLGRDYSFDRNYACAKHLFDKVISVKGIHPRLLGIAYLEKGVIFYRIPEKLDSAKYYFEKSLKYPCRGAHYAIRTNLLAEVFFKYDQFDSAYKYVSLALINRQNIYLKRDSYRILANIEYNRKRSAEMNRYIKLYQMCSDSVHNIENQPHVQEIQKLFYKDQEIERAQNTHRLFAGVGLLVFLIAGSAVFFLYRSYRQRKSGWEEYKSQLGETQSFVCRKFAERLSNMRELQQSARKGATPEERQQLDKELYEKCLHLNDWGAFCREINQAFNHIIDRLTEKYPSISRKEITWCCLHLLDVPLADRMVVLDASADSLYKLKQRLAKKLGLGSAKEMDIFLKKEAGL